MEVYEMIQANEMTKSDVKKLIQNCFVQAIAKQEQEPNFVPLTDEWDEEFGEQEVLAKRRIAELQIQTVAEKYDDEVKRLVWTLLTSNGFSHHDISEPRLKDLSNGMARILIEQQKLFLARLEDRFSDYTPVDPLFAQTSNGHSIAATSASSLNVFLGPNLGAAVETYLAANKKIWRPRTHTARVWQLRYLVEFVGAERPISSIKPDDIRRYRDAVLTLKANKGFTKTQTFKERQTDNVKARIKPKTADYIFQPVKAFFAWAISVEGLIQDNPAISIKLVIGQQKKGERSRRPFEPEEIKTLFRSPTFTGCQSQYRRDFPGTIIVRDGKYWLPILGYYTGCRLGELVQLAIEDVQKIDGHYFLDINEKLLLGADEKSVKSVAGVRKVPLHPDLFELGFLEFVAKRAKQDKGNVRLFKEIKFGADKQASTVYSKTFARLMNKIGLTDPSLVFHSWRHGVEDALRDAETQPYVIDAIVGHSDNSMGSKYGKGVSLKVMANAVEKMKLSVRLPELLKPANSDGLSANKELKISI
ncbi:MAG: tyrosine-type recombinase/integrase [Rhodocyclaceae bacterium]|nr:tyrosine-type recombinase/integrase [Rhodocyclaceae bacterium]